MNPALLAQLGSIAATANRGKIIGNTEELETLIHLLKKSCRIFQKEIDQRDLVKI